MVGCRWPLANAPRPDCQGAFQTGILQYSRVRHPFRDCETEPRRGISSLPGDWVALLAAAMCLQWQMGQVVKRHSNRRFVVLASDLKLSSLPPKHSPKRAKQKSDFTLSIRL